jgi:ATP-dependent Clp protease, protease subunit
MTSHVIHFLRSINADTLIGLQNTVHGALGGGATELSIHISSDGGSNDHGFAAYHLLRSLPIPVTTHCIGNVESMAIILFLAGEHRLIVPHGKVKIHPMHWAFAAGTVDHDRLTEFVASLDFDAKRYANIFNERTQGAQAPIDVTSHLMGQAKLLEAVEAEDSNIATGIADASIPSTAIRWWV